MLSHGTCINLLLHKDREPVSSCPPETTLGPVKIGGFFIMKVATKPPSSFIIDL